MGAVLVGARRRNRRLYVIPSDAEPLSGRALHQRDMRAISRAAESGMGGDRRGVRRAVEAGCSPRCCRRCHHIGFPRGWIRHRLRAGALFQHNPHDRRTTDHCGTLPLLAGAIIGRPRPRDAAAVRPGGRPHPDGAIALIMRVPGIRAALPATRSGPAERSELSRQSRVSPATWLPGSPARTLDWGTVMRVSARSERGSGGGVRGWRISRRAVARRRGTRAANPTADMLAMPGQERGPHSCRACGRAPTRALICICNSAGVLGDTLRADWAR